MGAGRLPLRGVPLSTATERGESLGGDVAVAGVSVCVCRAGGRVYVLGPMGLHECLAKGYELSHIAWDVKCELEQREDIFP